MRDKLLHKTQALILAIGSDRRKYNADIQTFVNDVYALKVGKSDEYQKGYNSGYIAGQRGKK